MERDPVTALLMVASVTTYITIALAVNFGRWAKYQATQKTR